MDILQTPSLQLLTSLWTLWQSLVADGSARLREACGVDVRGFIALSHLQDRPHQPAELADVLGMPRYEVSRLLRGLETQGLVRRRRSGSREHGGAGAQRDGRQVRVELTEAGRAAWQAGVHAVEAVTAPYLAGLDRAAQDHLIATLSRLTPGRPVHPTSTHPGPSTQPRAAQAAQGVIP